LLKIKNKEKENLPGLTVILMMDILMKTKWMAKVLISGLMEESINRNKKDMRVVTKVIRKMDLAFLHGLMVASIRVNG
jgi:hypothetical protein